MELDIRETLLRASMVQTHFQRKVFLGWVSFRFPRSLLFAPLHAPFFFDTVDKILSLFSFTVGTEILIRKRKMKMLVPTIGKTGL